MHTGVNQLPWLRTHGTAGALENSTMKMQNIFILYAMALFGLGRGLCSEWRRGDCKSVGAPAFVLSELRNRKAKPLITALFSAPAPLIVCLLFSATQDKSRRQRCTMSQ